jgi:hypothetical protein
VKREDVIKLMSVLRGAYPQFYRDVGRQEALDTISLWTDMFSEDDAAIVAAAVKALIATDSKGYPPHIGAVKAKIRQLTERPQMAPQEAWGMVWRAVQRSAYNSREEFERLPPMLRRLVGTPEQLKAWAQMDANTVQSVIGSNFQRSYQERAKQESEFQALPGDIKQMIGGLAERLALGHGNDSV